MFAATTSTTVSISGHVDLGTVGTSAGAGEVTVSAWYSGGSQLTEGTANTDSTGDFTISGLLPDGYQLQFTYNGNGSYYSTWYQVNNTYNPRAYSPQITATSDVSGLDEILPTEGSISGHVTLGTTGISVGPGEVAVTVEPAGSTNFSVPVYTDANGNYSIPNLIPTFYNVHFEYSGSGAYQSAYYPNFYNFPEAPEKSGVVVNSGPATDLAMQLPAEGTLTGRVFLGSTSTPAGAGQVTVTLTTTDNRLKAIPVAGQTATTDASGYYTFTGLDSIWYTPTFSYSGSGPYDPLITADYSQTPPNYEGVWGTSGTPFPDEIVPQYYSVSGHIYIGDASHPAAAGEVQVTINGTSVLGTPTTVLTDASGGYTFTGLLAGYRSIHLHYLGAGDYPDMYAPGNYCDFGNCTGQHITTSSLIADATMPEANSVSGVVTTDGGSPLANVTVYVFGVDPKTNLSVGGSNTTTANDGTYSFYGLASGNYQVEFVGPAGVYTDQKYENEGDYYYPDLIPLTGGDDYTNIDAHLHLPATLTGTVTAVGGTAADFATNSVSAEVEVYDGSTSAWVETGDYYLVSLSAGAYRYTIPNLAPDTYRIRFDYFGQTGSFNNATFVSPPIVVAAGQTTTYNATINVTGPNSADTSIDSITGSKAGVTVTGWAVWPGSPSTNVGLAVNIGSNWYAVTANQPNAEAVAAEAGYVTVGPNHGFNSTIALAAGTYNACIWVMEPTGPAGNIGCQTVTVQASGRTIEKLDSATGSAAGIAVSGYALYPDNDAASVSVAVNIGASWYGLTANQHSEEGASDVPGASVSHGFAGTIALAPGTYSVCIWVSEPTGPAVNTGCRTVVVPAPSRTAYAVDSVTGSTAGVSVAGWALYPDTGSATASVALSIGASWYGLTANQANTESLTGYPSAGSNHGFAGTVPLAPGTYSVCVWLTEPSGPAVNTGCHTVVVPAAARAVLHSDSVTGGLGALTLSGWDVFPDSLSAHVGIAVNIGAAWYGLTANATNAEVPVAYPAATSDHGYAGSIALAPGTYNVCIWTTEPSGPAVNTGCHSAVVTAPHAAVSNIDSVTGGVGSVSIAGWDVWPDSLASKVGIAVNIGANWYGATANTPNAESASAYPASTVDHGYATTLALAPGTYNVCIWTTEPSGPAVNTGCRTATVTSAPPAVAAFETATAVNGGIQVTGYSEFPASPGTAVGVAANIGTAWFGFTANGTSTTAPGHGFTGFIAKPHGTYSVCLWTTEPSGPAVNIGCKSVAVG